MSFLGVLGKIGKGALNLATGGIGGTIMDAIGGAGQIASGISAGRGAGRQAEAQAMGQHDLLAQRAQQQQLRQMLAADLLGSQGAPQDARAQRFFRPSGITPDSLSALRQPVPLSPLPSSGKLDSFLNTLGMVGQFGGALSPLLQKKPQPTPGYGNPDLLGKVRF